MASKTCQLLCDKTAIAVKVPDHWQILQGHDPPPLEQLSQAIDRALAEPLDCKPLGQLAAEADKSRHAVIVISDITRPVPSRDFLPQIIDCLEKSGYPSGQIVILIATGMHRPSSRQERLGLVGQQLLDRYRIVDHKSEDPQGLVELPGKTSAGTAVSIDRLYAQAGLRVLTGFIEPHFMAGFSGGRKGICPGLVDLPTLENFHGYKFLSDPNARSGVLEGNPCDLEALEVAKMCPPDFLFNVTIDANNKIIGIYAGNWQTAHLAGTKAVRKHMTVAVDELFDVVITTGGGYPLDTTFYQTTKGMEVASYYVKPGGKLIVLSGCADGIGSQQYRTIMFQYDNYQQFLADIANTDKVRKDQWAFQMHARVLDKVGLEGLIMAAQGISDDELARCHVTPICQSVGSGGTAEQMQKLVDILADGSSTVALLPRGPYILPKVPAQ